MLPDIRSQANQHKQQLSPTNRAASDLEIALRPSGEFQSHGRGDSTVMTTTQTIPCPNCGQAAQRIYALDPHSGCRCPDNLLTRTECPVCDYVLSTCTLSGSVIEAYAPGIQLMSNTGESKRRSLQSTL